jgi:hypothetical protein
MLSLATATIGPIELVIVVVLAMVVLLAAVYALTKFVVWAAQRRPR